MKAKSKQSQPKVTPAIRAAYEKWLTGVHRGVLMQDLKMSRPALRKAFVAISGKTWKETKALRKGAPKSAKKQGATKVTVKKASEEAATDSTARRKAA